jgi:hypothetical protein
MPLGNRHPSPHIYTQLYLYLTLLSIYVYRFTSACASISSAYSKDFKSKSGQILPVQITPNGRNCVSENCRYAFSTPGNATVPGNFGTPFLASLAEQKSIETEATAHRVMTPMAMFDIYM